MLRILMPVLLFPTFVVLLAMRQLGMSSTVKVVGDCLSCDAQGYRLTLFGYAVKEEGGRLNDRRKLSVYDIISFDETDSDRYL